MVKITKPIIHEPPRSSSPSKVDSSSQDFSKALDEELNRISYNSSSKIKSIPNQSKLLQQLTTLRTNNPTETPNQKTLQRISETPMRNDISWKEGDKLLFTMGAIVTPHRHGKLVVQLEDRIAVFPKPIKGQPFSPAGIEAIRQLTAKGENS